MCFKRNEKRLFLSCKKKKFEFRTYLVESVDGGSFRMNDFESTNTMQKFPCEIYFKMKAKKLAYWEKRNLAIPASKTPFYENAKLFWSS